MKYDADMRSVSVYNSDHRCILYYIICLCDAVGINWCKYDKKLYIYQRALKS